MFTFDFKSSLSLEFLWCFVMYMMMGSFFGVFEKCMIGIGVWLGVCEFVY